MRVHLTPSEMLMAAQTGITRNIRAIVNGSRHAYGMSGAGWSEDIEGACAEMALAKALGIYWSNQLADRPNKKPDVGGFEVRLGSKDHYRLVIRKNDDDAARVAFLTGIRGEYRIRGWVIAGEVKRPEFWRSEAGREPQFYVPHSCLRPPETLPGRTVGGEAVARSLSVPSETAA